MFRRRDGIEALVALGELTRGERPRDSKSTAGGSSACGL